MLTLDVHAPASVKARKGISTPALLVTITVAVLLAIAALDLAQLSHQRHQIQNGSDAAVLAATAQLHDRRWLYLGPNDPSGPSVAETLSALDWVLDEQITAAQFEAERYAFENKVAGRPIVVDAEDVFVGYVAEPADRAFAANPAPEDGLNSLVVKASRRKSAGNLPMLWMASQVGLDKLEMHIHSQAVIDHRVYGLRPIAAYGPDGVPTSETHVPIPIVPFAVMPEASDLSIDVPPTFPDNLWWAKGPQDDFIVDPQTQQVRSGSDGIAEFVIRVPSTDAGEENGNARDAAVLKFGDAGIDAEIILDICRFGLTSFDLASTNGELNLADEENLPILLAALKVNDEVLATICQQLPTSDNSVNPPVESLIGAPRIFPIGAALPPGDDGGGSGGREFPGGGATGGVFPGGGNTGGDFPGGGQTEGDFILAGFVAGAIVDCMQENDGSLLLVVQPCVMQTPTALVGGVVSDVVIPRNPWIGKLLLNR